MRAHSVANGQRTYWNGLRVPARRVWLCVGPDARVPTPWFTDLIGQWRRAVEVDDPLGRQYLDDDAFGTSELIEVEVNGQTLTLRSDPGFRGWAWMKVTAGRGMPVYGHRNLCPMDGYPIRPRGEDA